MKKKNCLFLSIHLLAVYAFAQKTDHFIKPPALGFYFFYHDFSTADYIRKHSLSQAFRDNEFANIKNMNAGLAAGYLKGLSGHLDFSGTLAVSSLSYLNRDGQSPGANHLLFELDASLMAKLLTDRSWVSPYFQAGLGFSKYRSDYGAFIPAGIGLQFVFFHDAYLFINAQYRMPVSALVNYHFYYSVGLAGNIGKRKKVNIKQKPVVAAVKPSQDRDRITDKDGDGIPDQDDQCPVIPGFIRYHGCPVPDRDGDGIDDEHDSCIAVPGLAGYHGCPVPDTDKDGVNDEEDKCITVPGLKSNQGCPLVAENIEKRIAFAAKNIFFITGSYRLSEKSYQPLDEVVKILKDNPNLQLDIEGHTDNTGSADKNQTLSENRARAVEAYLEEKGIEKIRLHAVGYGASKPVADNNTVKGRTANRRVVFILRYF